MAWHFSGGYNIPADYVRLGQGKFRNIFLSGEALTFPLTGTSAVATWEIVDHTGLTVSTGGPIAANAGTWTAPAMNPGWYRVFFRRASSIAGWGTSQGGGMFVVTRSITGMPPRPPISLPTVGAITDGGLYWTTLTGPLRLGAVVTDPEAKRTEIDPGVTQHTTYYTPYDTTRAKPLLMSYAAGTDTTDPAVATATIATQVNRYPAITHWEGENEPNSGMPDDTFAPKQQRFYQNVKAARSSAQVCGPCPVNISPAGLTALRKFLTAGGGQWIDTWSFHTYNAHMGDLVMGRRTWDGFQALLTEFGQWGKPRLNSEASSMFGDEYGAGQFLRQAARTMLDLFLNEQYGVPKESWSIFYPNSAGFWDYPSFIETDEFNPFPTVATLLTHSQELLGTAFEARLDFGTVDNDVLIGSRHRRADGTGVVALLSAGNPAIPVTLQFTGGSPASVQTYDAYGRAGTATVTGGLATITVGTLPTYVRLPTGVTAAPVQRTLTNRSAGGTAAVTGQTEALVFADDFERANGPVGNGWSAFGSGTMSITGGVVSKTGGDFSVGGIIRDMGAADGILTVGGVGTATNSVVFRYVDAANFLVLYDNNLYQVQAGVHTAIGTQVSLRGDLEVRLNGSSITTYAGGLVGQQVTSTFNQTATKHGVTSYVPGSQAASFSFRSGLTGSHLNGAVNVVVNGPWLNKLYSGGGNTGDATSVWEADLPPTTGTPVDVTATLPTPAFADRVVVHCPPAWQADLSVIRDADVQVNSGGTWTTVGTIGYQPRLEPFQSSHLEGANGYAEAWDNDTHVFEVTFTRRQISAARVRVREVTAGGAETLAFQAGYGATTSTGTAVNIGLGSYETPRLALQRLAVYDSGSGAAPVSNPYVVLRIT